MAPMQQIYTADNAIRDDEARELEKQAAALTGASYGVITEYARDGITFALAACGAVEGSRALCPALGSASILKSMEALGAKPVFVDINPNTLNIDPYCLEYVINKCIREKTRVPTALVAPDLFGLPYNYSEIARICDKYGISLVEDMGGAFGASCGGLPAGSTCRFAVASFFEAASFDEGRPFGSEGIVLCHSEEDAYNLKQLRGEGSVQLSIDGEWGSGAAGIMISEMLERFAGELERRRKIAGWYKKKLKGKVRIQEAGTGYESAYTQFVIMLESLQSRTSVTDKLSEERIPFAIYYPNTLHHYYRTAQNVTLINAEKASQKLISLPIHPYLSENVVDYICNCVLEASC